MTETEKNKKELKRASFDFLQKFIKIWRDLDVHMTYILFIWVTKPPYLHSAWVFGLEEEYKILLNGDMQSI